MLLHNRTIRQKFIFYVYNHFTNIYTYFSNSIHFFCLITSIFLKYYEYKHYDYLYFYEIYPIEGHFYAQDLLILIPFVCPCLCLKNIPFTRKIIKGYYCYSAQYKNTGFFAQHRPERERHRIQNNPPFILGIVG